MSLEAIWMDDTTPILIDFIGNDKHSFFTGISFRATLMKHGGFGIAGADVPANEKG